LRLDPQAGFLEGFAPGRLFKLFPAFNAAAGRCPEVVFALMEMA